MIQYEYQTLRSPTAASLSKHGLNGWKVVSVLYDRSVDCGGYGDMDRVLMEREFERPPEEDRRSEADKGW